MKALVYHGPRQLRWQDWPDPPPPAAGEAGVSVRAVGICGSDLHGFQGRSNRRQAPMVMGHEFTGTVDALGAGVDRAWLGRRVVVRPFLHCGACEWCVAGRENLCLHRRYLGANADGAMAERIVVPAANLLPVADGLSDDAAALTEPLAVAMHATLRAGPLEGRRAVVVGGGTIGLLTLMALRQRGAAAVAMIEPQPYRQQVARQAGAESVTAAPPEGAAFDIAVDALGIAETFAACLGLVRPGGTLVALGGWQTVPADLARVVAREVEIRGSFNFTPATFAEALQWLEQGRIDAAPLVTCRRPLADGARAFEDLTEHRVNDIKVTLVPETTP